MSLKLIFFLGLMVLSTIEAKHFFKKLHQTKQVSALETKLPHKVADHLTRKRRDVEDNTTSGEIDEEAALGFLQFLVAAAWEGDKYDVLTGLLEEVSDHDSNITIVGWQRVLDADGSIKEIRTIQLVIPPKPLDDDAPDNIVEDEDDDDDDDESFVPHKDVEELREVFRPFAQIGLQASMVGESFTDDGEVDELLYLDQDELYVHAENFSLLNKTAVASGEQISHFIDGLKPRNLGKPTVLKYNVDGHLELEHSHIRPHILGSVLDHYEASDKILTEGPQVIAQISQQYSQKEIPKQLAQHYNQAYPEYKWRVLDDPEDFYVTRDVTLTLTYDNFDFDENSDVAYVAIGIKK